MILQHLSALTADGKTQINFRFHRGSSDFPNSYFISTEPNIAKALRSALSFAIFGQNPQAQFTQSQLTLADEAGNIWQIKRKLTRYVVAKNGQLINLELYDFLAEILNQTNPKEGETLKRSFGIGRYLLSQNNNKFYVSILGKNTNSTQENGETVYRFLNDTSEEIFAACKLNLDTKGNFTAQDFIYTCTALSSIYTSFNESSTQINALFDDKTTEPRETMSEIASLQDQVKLMEKIALVAEELTIASPLLEQHKQQLVTIDKKLKENLEFCNLDSLPKHKTCFDWNVPLQCLSYLNVLDKMIPVLQQSLKQFQKHFDSSLENVKGENSRITQIKKALFYQITQCKQTLTKTGSNTLEDARHKKGVLANLFEHFKEGPSEAKNNSFLNEEERKIMRYLNAMSDTLEQLTMDGVELANTPLALQDFLAQIIRKRDTLKEHWRTICAELHIENTISLHDFLQYTLKYNELFILQQKLLEIEEIVKNRSQKFSELRKLILEWNERTGSQKVISLDSNQLTLSEAQNIIRYKKEKELKLKTIIEKQVIIESNNHLKRLLLEKISLLKKEWAEKTKNTPLATIAINDARIQTLFEKSQLLNALQTIHHVHPPLQLFPAFPPTENLELFCFWKIPLRASSDKHIKDLLHCLKGLPQDALHILFLSDPGFNLELRKLGMGQALPLSPSSFSAEPLTSPEKTRTLASPKSTQPAHSSSLATAEKGLPKASTNKNAAPSPLSPKVREVLDLLNGTISKG